MKRDYFFYRLFSCFLLVASIFSVQAQTWQWGKRGGSANSGIDTERVVSSCIDIYGNLYVTSPIGNQAGNVDGNAILTYNVTPSRTDGVISSFTCDGGYRWSKVIGGENSDRVTRLGSDNLGNIYAIGKVSRVAATQNAVHFDTDSILPGAPGSQNIYKESIFLIKYDSEGNFKWLRMPQPADVSNLLAQTYTWSYDLMVDAQGNSYWVCMLPAGIYAGSYEVTASSYHILKYDTDGNFLGGVDLNMQVSSDGNFGTFRMKRNPNNGNFYMGATVRLGEFDPTVTINGEAITKSRILVAFSGNGSFLWKRENESQGNYGGLADVDIDIDNNIFFTSGAGPVSASAGVPDSFNGVQFEAVCKGQTSAPYPYPFITKLSPNGETIWQTNGCKSFPHAITINGDEVAVSGGIGNDVQWQNLSYTPPNPGTGYHPFMARFNKTTGDIISINALESSGGGDDVGTTLTTDSNGSYYMGGSFGSSVIVGGTALVKNGGETDFFIAKFGTGNCEFLAVNTPEKETMQAYPNPVQDLLHLRNKDNCSYVLYSILGTQVKSGNAMPQGTINLEEVSAGLYLLQLTQDGVRTVVKIVKE